MLGYLRCCYGVFRGRLKFGDYAGLAGRVFYCVYSVALEFCDIDRVLYDRRGIALKLTLEKERERESESKKARKREKRQIV